MAAQLQDRVWTYADLESLPDDGRRYEIIEGTLFEMATPNLRHARVITNLGRLLLPVVDGMGGLIYTASFNVFFPGADPVQPGVVVLLPGGRARQEVRGVEGVPDVVIDVLSPSNRAHDILTKRALYERAGVREYWLADPEARTIEVLVREEGGFRSRGAFRGDERVVSTVLPGVGFAGAEVFAVIEEIAG